MFIFPEIKSKQLGEKTKYISYIRNAVIQIFSFAHVRLVTPINKYKKIYSLILTGILILIINLVFFLYADLKRDQIHDVQYMSLLHSINSAATYEKSGVYFAIDYPDGSTRAIETLANDDLGYTFILTTLVRLNVIELSDNIRSFITADNYYLFGNFDKKIAITGDKVIRKYDPTIEEIIETIWPVSFYTYFFAVSLISIILLLLFPDVAVARILIFNFLLALLPSIAPSLFFSRLHSHSLITTAMLCGVAAFSLVIATRKSSVHRASILLILAGLLLGFADLIRHAEGLILFVTVLGITLISSAGWKRRVLNCIMLIVSFSITGLYIDYLRGERNETVEITGASYQQANHPFGHIGLLGLIGHKNSLGIRNVKQMEEIVAEHAGVNVKMGQPEYHEAAQNLFFQYVKENPREYLSIIYSKLKVIAFYSIQRLLPDKMIPKDMSPEFTEVMENRAFRVLVMVFISIGVAVLIGSWEQRISALALGVAMLGCFVLPLISRPYFSFGITVLLYLWVCAGIIMIVEQLQHGQNNNTLP